MKIQRGGCLGLTLKYIKLWHCLIMKEMWVGFVESCSRARLSLVSTLCGPLAPWGTLCHTVYEVMHLESNNEMNHLDKFFYSATRAWVACKGFVFSYVLTRNNSSTLQGQQQKKTPIACVLRIKFHVSAKLVKTKRQQRNPLSHVSLHDPYPLPPPPRRTQING